MTIPKRLLLALVALLAAAILLFVLYVWAALSWSYSEGERAGFVQKFSKKGWVCKTWEGEMLLTAMPGAIPEKFEFTVRDEEVTKRLQENIGKRMILSYSQHKGLPGSCFGDTQYFVSKVVVNQ